MKNQTDQTDRIPFIAKFFATGFYSGYSPIVPGTVGSAVGLLIYALPGIENLYYFLPLIIVAFIIGIISSSILEEKLGDDPQIIVIDEIVGMWCALIFLPKTILVVLSAFIIFRILDIIKPYPARHSERLKNGWGIMVDDVISGVYTNIILQIAVYFMM
ncbi:MAG: phosphatidylglycerophosphatase A [Bacteroidota bacterium]|nr:phosphatidylglycerophosphatase A [Bacteroidota bacterium]